MATLRGETVDRPPVCFYEINGMEDTSSEDPFNIYTDPSWQPAIDLARDKTDRIVIRGAGFKDIVPDPLEELAETETTIKDGSRFTVQTVKVGDRTLTTRSRRDPDVNTVWCEEHLL